MNGSQPLFPSGFSNPIATFTPPTSASWVNGLWFLSLVISLTCALLSTLVQQWARRYQRVAYPRYTPNKRARIRAFYKHGVEKLHIPWAIELLPALLHISLFLFFAGLSVFLFGIQHVIFKVVIAWIALCGFLYACLTFLPIIYKNSPYSGPLSGFVSFCLSGPLSVPFSFCLTGIRRVFSQLLQKLSQINPPICFSLRNRGPNLRNFFSYSMIKTAEKFAFDLNPDIDYSSLLWTFEALDEDTDLEKFFEGLPLLCDSETGRKLQLQEGFIVKNKKALSSALIGLMNRTLSSNLVTDFVKQRRMIICTKVVQTTSLLGRWSVLCRVLFGDWRHFLKCVEFGLLVQNWTSINDKATSFAAQCAMALTISFSRHRDERWFQLACGLLNKPKSLLHKYNVHGDNTLLANVIFIVQRTIQTYSASEERHREDILNTSSRTLEMICKLDIRRTLPDLQHEFCGLWNLLVDMVQNDKPPPHVRVSTMTTLRNTRKLYTTLHECSISPPTAFYTTTDDRGPVLDDPMLFHKCSIRPCLPILDSQFREPTPDAVTAPPTPSIVVMPSPTVPHPPTGPPTLLVSSPPFIDAHPLHSVDSTISFPEPQLTRPDTSKVSREWNVQPPTPPPRSSASCSLTNLGNVSTQHLDPLGGHV